MIRNYCLSYQKPSLADVLRPLVVLGGDDTNRIRESYGASFASADVIFSGPGNKAFDLAVSAGFSEGEFEIDERPGSTLENASYTKDLIGIQPIILCTSQWHMPRSRWCFQREGYTDILEWCYEDPNYEDYIASESSKWSESKALASLPFV